MFFFSSRRRHTRLQGDWSSDVCSSDLQADGGGERDKDCGPRARLEAGGLGLCREKPRMGRGHQPVEGLLRSEERRVGEECRSRGSPDPLKKKKNAVIVTTTHQ